MFSSRFRKTVVGSGFAVVFVLVGLNFWGSRLPETNSIHKTIVVNADSQDVWELLKNPERVTEWNPIVMDTSKVMENGIDSQWREHYKTGDKLLVTYHIDDATHQLTKSIADPDFPFQGRWIFQILAMGDKTQVTVEEQLKLPHPGARLVRRILGPSNWLNVQLKGLGEWSQKPGMPGPVKS